MTDLHWNLRGHLKDFRTDGRLFVLLSIYLHKNTRNRAWPSNDLIATETGLSRAPISRSIKWLADNHAVTIVPFDKRIGDEKKLPNRKNIYQLTGVIKINGKYRPYMYMTPEGWAGVIQELTDLGNSSLVELLNNDDSLQIERLPSERLPSEPKGITSGKGIKDNSSNTAPKKKNSEISPIHTEWLKFAVMGNALLKAFKNDFVPIENQTAAAIEPYLDAARDLTRINAPIEHIELLYKFVAAKAERDGWSTFSVKALPKYYTDFLKSLQAKPAVHKPANIIEDTPQTEEDRAALLEAMKNTRPDWEKKAEVAS